ncbi:MAG: efflux RND transporter permease subunit [Treponema sp.]|jgi:HAE1 family hydrophobic/amphiphilic exporter-1|nr:efflux RND transporter permease subunit [Treponema sp.]
MGIAQKVVSRPVLGIICFGLVAIVGLYLVPGVAIDMLPEMHIPMLAVSASYSGAGPETVEETVTRPLEAQLVNVSGLKKLSSESSEGSSIIMLEFNYGTNIEARVNDIRDRLDRVKGALPDNAGNPAIFQFDPNSMPILRIAVTGDRSQDELRAIAENFVQDSLEQIDGVASTNLMGGRERIVKIEVSQNRLEAYGLTITGIRNSLAAQNLELGAGSIEEGSTNYGIRTTGTFASIRDIAETVVARINGADIRLQDVGTVSMGYPRENSTVYINGETGVYLGIVKQSGSNSVAVADRVYAKLEEIRSALPADINLSITLDDTSQIREMIEELVNSALLGAALAMTILFLFLRNIKSAVIIGISIPFSILVTMLMMTIFGITLNMLTMTGLILGVGMIVDCSIVVLENIFKYRERGARPSVAAVLGSHEVMSSIISSTLTTICVFLPILLFKNRLGMQGELLQGLIFTVGIALASSLLVAIFLVPILAGKFLPIESRTQKTLKNPLLKGLDSLAEKAFTALDDGYRRLLSLAVSHRFVTVALIAALFAGSVIAVPKMRVVMMPGMNEESISLSVTMPLGSTYNDTKAVMLQLQDFAIAEIEGAKSIIVDVGSSGAALGGSGSNMGSLTVSLDLNDPAADTSAQARAKLLAHARDFPNASMSFSQSMEQMMAGGKAIDIILRIDAIDRGLAAANEIAELLKTNVPELAEISVDMTEGLPQVEVAIDRKRAYNMGLSINSIAGEISAAMNGATATTFRQAGNEYAVVIQLAEADRSKLPDLERIFIASGNGTLYPLSNFAALEKGSGPVKISRENQSRVIHVTANLAEENLRTNDVENKVRQVLSANFVAPEGVRLSYGGQWKEIIDTTKTYLLVLTLAILLVFGVMAGQYESFKDPLINLCAVPFLAIGVVYIHLIATQPLSMFTLVGVVMLSGIVVNNGIVLVDYTNILVGRGVPVLQAVLDAGFSRLRPVLMTTLTTILGLIPMAFFPGESSTMMQPIGLTVIGGLVSSTLITLFFIPVMYSFVNEHRGRKRREARKCGEARGPAEAQVH